MFRFSARANSFGANMLGLRLADDGGAVHVDRFDSDGFALTLPWPAWLSRPDGRVCLASALAICDEVTTFGMAAYDPKHRPGVSVTLSAQRESDAAVEPGEEMTVASRTIKAGQTLAWMHFEVSRGDEVLLTGRHLKFQPSGLPPGWDFVSRPMLRPALYAAAERYIERYPASAPPPLPSRAEARRAHLSMTAAAAAAGDESLDPFLTSSRLISKPVAPAALSAALSRRHGNPGATLHGGCGSMLLEEAAAASYCAARGVAAPPPVQRMDVRLLGAIDVSRPRTVHASAIACAERERAHATLRLPGKATPAVEADVWW